MTDRLKIAFVHNFASHHTYKTHEILAKYYDVKFYFFSRGNESDWMQTHGLRTDNFDYHYLHGFSLGGTRITPTLPLRLFWGSYLIFIKCINGRFALPATYIISKIKHKPFILWTGIWCRIDTKFHRLFYPLINHIYSHADAIVVYGEHVKKYLISEGVKKEKIFIAAHAVDNEYYQRIVSEEEQNKVLLEIGVDRRKKIILFIGRLQKEKGLEYLIEAFSLLKRTDAVLIVAGEGSRRAALRDLADELDIAHIVFFPGYVSTYETVVYYSLAYAFVLPSMTTPIFKEPWGFVVNEAFNQGVPVIATTAVGAAAGGLIEHCSNGLIIPERDINALTNSMQMLLEDEQLRNTFGSNAKQKVEKWDKENMVMGFRKAIEYVTDKNR